METNLIEHKLAIALYKLSIHYKSHLKLLYVSNKSTRWSTLVIKVGVPVVWQVSMYLEELAMATYKGLLVIIIMLFITVIPVRNY